MENKKEIDVVGIGVSTIDILTLVEHFPGKEEVQRSFSSIIDGGGPVATALVTLARLGCKVQMLDSIGDDWIGKLLIEDFRKEKVNVDYIKVNSSFSSSTASVLVRKSDGARTIIFTPGNSPELSEEDIKEEIISKARYIHLNGRHLNACIKACKIAKESNTIISFDGGSHRFRNELKQLVPLVDVCIVSRDFAESYTNEKEIQTSAGILLKTGPKIVVITDGINGSWLFAENINGYHQKALKLPAVIDTTGCGDSFHGAFLYCLCNNYTLYDAISFSSTVAALNTRKLGGRAGLPILSEVLDFMKLNKE